MTKPDHSLSDGEGGHTPGPWEHEGDTVFVTEYMQLCCGRGYHSCCGDPEIEVEQRQIAQCAPANARLIAAAPTMYDYVTRKAAEGDAGALEIVRSIYAAR